VAVNFEFALDKPPGGCERLPAAGDSGVIHWRLSFLAPPILHSCCRVQSWICTAFGAPDGHRSHSASARHEPRRTERIEAVSASFSLCRFLF
jgi:hypothetical protein